MISGLFLLLTSRPLPLLMADAADRVKLGLVVVDAKVDLTAIGLELGFSTAAGSNAAAELF
jgi:hypothetical protein